MTTQVQIPMFGLGLVVVLLSTGQLALVKTDRKITMEDRKSGSVGASVFPDTMVLHSDEGFVEVRYNTLYDPQQFPLLRQWLKQQNFVQSDIEGVIV